MFDLPSHTGCLPLPVYGKCQTGTARRHFWTIASSVYCRTVVIAQHVRFGREQDDKATQRPLVPGASELAATPERVDGVLIDYLLMANVDSRQESLQSLFDLHLVEEKRREGAVHDIERLSRCNG